jgi:carbon monoxide dehydrogenase subunit G
VRPSDGDGVFEGVVKVAGDSSLGVAPERAYELLQDPAILAKCIPGCEGLERIGEDEYAMKLTMGIAGISGRFDGKVRIADRKPPLSFRLIVEGSGKIGFMKGDGTLGMSAADGGTKVEFAGEVNVGGAIAIVGQRLIETTAKMIIKKFFDSLAEEATAAAHT